MLYALLCKLKMCWTHWGNQVNPPVHTICHCWRRWLTTFWAKCNGQLVCVNKFLFCATSLIEQSHSSSPSRGNISNAQHPNTRETEENKKYINRRATSPGETKKKIVVGYNLCLRGVCCAKEFELHPSANLERQKNSRIKQKNIEYKNKEEKKIQQKRRDRDSEREKLVPLPMPPPLHAIELLVNKIRDACVNCVSEFGMEWRAIHTYISLYDVFFCFVLLSVLFFVSLLGGRR